MRIEPVIYIEELISDKDASSWIHTVTRGALRGGEMNGIYETIRGRREARVAMGLCAQNPWQASVHSLTMVGRATRDDEVSSHKSRENKLEKIERTTA
jgi:hypothetical protein